MIVQALSLPRHNDSWIRPNGLPPTSITYATTPSRQSCRAFPNMRSRAGGSSTLLKKKTSNTNNTKTYTTPKSQNNSPHPCQYRRIETDQHKSPEHKST